MGSWQAMSWPMRILRGFLGGTFLYAGVQKFLDRGFLRAGSPTYIGTQLRAFAQGTPAAPVMHLLAHVPVLTGVGVALVEIAIGIATLLGVGLLGAAFAGFAISVTLWLSATWHVHPYFLGSDSIYAVAWLSLLVGTWEGQRERRQGRAPSVAERVDGIDRRAVLRGGVVAALSLVVASIGRTAASPLSKDGTGLGAIGSPRTRAAGPQPPTGSSPSTSTAPPSPKVQGTIISNLSRLPVGGAAAFTAPGIGPAALFHLSDGRVVAYSRICTHAGCAVGYNSGAKLMVCPCHGAEFDPAQHARPVAGPAPTALRSIPVVVDRASGNIIVPA